MQYRCIAHVYSLIDYRHLGIPEYVKVFCNILSPKNDITRIQTTK